MRGLWNVALAMLFVAACGRDSAITAPEAPSAVPLAPGVLALGVDSTTGASIETNKDDYMPGEVVHVVGHGWAPGETVNLHMTENPDTHADVDTSVVADSSGGFSIHYYDVQTHDLGVTFTLTATGATSGSVAVATFTDGSVILVTSPINLVTTFTYDRFNGNGTCEVTATPPAQPSSTNQSLAYNTGLGLNNGQSILVTVPTVAGYTYDGYASSGVAVSPASAASNTTLCLTGFVGGGTGTVTLNYTAVVVTNTAPILNNIGTQTVDEGQTVGFTATATDDGLPTPASLTFTLIAPLCLNPVPAAATITAGGVFSWVTTEADGPGTYCAKVQVSDGDLTDDQEFSITVNEVNLAPVLTVPTDFTTQWGVDPADQQATATDDDLPANTLTFSKVSGPSWVTVEADGDITYTTIPSGDVGANVVTIKVEDNGNPVMSDQESYTITVTNRPTSLDYTGKNAGQYSDESTLSATLVDIGTGSPLGGTPIAGETVTLWFNLVSVCSGTTDANGVVTCDHPVTIGASTVKVQAKYAGANGYDGDNSDEENFVVSEENATFTNVSINGGNGSIPVSQLSFTVTLDVKELRIGSPLAEPDPNDGALPGDISLATPIEAKIIGLATNQQYTGSCGTGSGGSASYASVRNYTCTFSNSGNPFVVDAYTLTLKIPLSNDYWVATTYEEGFAIWDPAAGFATGGGWFMLDGDRVSFGFSYSPSKGKTPPRSGFVVVRHMSGGGVCRVKSNNQMNAPVVSGNTVVLTGKGNYSCTDALGVVIPGQSQGNINVGAYAEDWATSGKDADKFWVTNSAIVSPQNYLQMSQTNGAAANAVLIKGGNVQVPQPQKK